jgi:SAM-dependent methyltransferase
LLSRFRRSKRTPPGEAPLFDQPFYEAITRARLDHLEKLGLPVDGKSVIDVGCGTGRLSEHFAQRGCEVTCVDGRAENIEQLRASYPGRTAAVVDVESDALLEQGSFQVVFCYGLLYHLAEPWGFLQRAGKLAGELLLLETCVADAEEPMLSLVRDPDDPTMALRAVGSRPSAAYIAAALASAGFPCIYHPRSEPDHPDFRWERRGDRAVFRDGHALRQVFVASREPLDLPGLEPLTVAEPPLESA